MDLFRRKSIDELQAAAAASGMLKNLAAVDLLMLGIGAVIGTGIFVLTGVAAAKYAGPAVPLSFILSGLTCALAGLAYAEFASIVKKGRHRTLVFGGRFAYLYFLKHYGLNYVTAYDTCSSEGEPGVQRIAQVIQYIRKKDIRCIFHEEFVVPKVAQSIAEQTGAKLLTFSTAHNLTKDEFEKGVTFLDIMKANRDSVEQALTL